MHIPTPRPPRFRHGSCLAAPRRPDAPPFAVAGGWRACWWEAVSLLVASALLASCGGSATEATSDGATGGLRVVATTSILGDLAANLVADDGEVEVLIPPGTDPHGFDPSAADVATLRDADLVVANGLGLEEQLDAALEAARTDGVPVVKLAPELDPIAFAHEEAGDAERQDHGDEAQDRLDPHVWFDPVRMADGVELLAAELASVATLVDEDEWQDRAEAYRAELLAVHQELERRFGEIPPERRKLITNHATFGYLADRYGLEIVGTVVPGGSPHSEPSAAGFAHLVEELRAEGIEVVFAEHTDGTALAEQLAAEAQGKGLGEVEVVRVHTGSLGEPGSDAETYLALLRTTGNQIVDALG